MTGAVLGRADIRIPFSDGCFLEFDVAVVDASLPILLGEDVLHTFKISVLRTDGNAILQMGNCQITCNKLPSGHLEIPIGSEPSIYYTLEELCTLHKRFGHVSANKLCSLIRKAEGSEAISYDLAHQLKDKLKKCGTCQWYSGRRTSYRVAADIETEFNATVGIDFLFLQEDPGEGNANMKVLQIACYGTKWTAAAVCTESDAQGVFSCFFRIWISVYGAPRRVKADCETVLTSSDFRNLCLGEGIVVDSIEKEAHWHLGIAERFHEPLRKVYLRISRDQPALDADTILSIATRAMNNTVGPEGMTPALLVFGCLPRLSIRPENAPHDSRETQERRLSAMLCARREYEIEASKLRLQAAKRSRAPEFPRESDELRPGVAVLVRREESHEWTGPFVLENLDGTRATIIHPAHVRARARKSQFHINNVKLYILENHTSIFTMDSDFWEEAEIAEMKGLVEKDTILPITKPPPGANVLGSRFENRIKTDGRQKARLVVQGFRDPEAKTMNIEAPTLSKTMMRVLVSTAVVQGHEIVYRDYEQAYLQSTYPMQRDVYIRLNERARRILKQASKRDWPGFALLKKPLYGLSESGSYWHKTLQEALKRHGFRPGALDPCVLHLGSNGAVGTLVDDVLVQGDAICLEAEKRASDRFKNKGLMTAPFIFNGVTFTQTNDSPRNYKLENTSYAGAIPECDKSFDSFRSVRGKVAYLASQTRPDLLCLSAKLSQITAEKFEKQHVSILNAAVASLKADERSGELWYKSLDQKSLRLRVFADAAYASNDDATSQLGFAIFLGDETERVHFLAAHSAKARQVTHSVMGAELLALCQAFDFAEALQVELLRLGISVWISLSTDSKQVYDAIARSTVMQEKRLMIRMLLLREGLADLRIQELTLVPGSQNIADALTKVKKCGLWNRVLRTGLLADFSVSKTFFLWN
ncbi:Retrovirus-related Pol polyprotein from transposon [Porphyridium purpureum]|uniref:Retrovirus-related Pol polyprotein from transposon n=1 Tax=Porphyridium purpureum TaxID=35688 RepID=A0A5J4YVH7_PORPP|nr:Retrovirus-related Pol polyprotein from transposon [Porphyridium purpureum]|eukprot:POR5515..scf227_4